MMDVFFRSRRLLLVLGVAVGVSAAGVSSGQQHGRKYKAPPATSHIVVTVEKGFNEKPLVNVAVVFHAVKDDQSDGNLEVKTDSQGRATLDLLEIGSHVTVQVIASGFATFATEFDLTGDTKELLVKMERPRAQISNYVDNEGKTSQVKPGVQEPPYPKTTPKTTPQDPTAPTAVKPQPASPTAPLQTTPATDMPSTPGASPAPPTAGSPK